MSHEDEYGSAFERALVAYRAQRDAQLAGLRERDREAEARDLRARHYRRWTFMLGAMGASWYWPYVKLGPLTLYAYSHGIGWTWDCGPGHELRWRRLWRRRSDGLSG